jgi:hypothetical protein
MRHVSDARPRAHTDLDPAEIFGFGGDRVSERKKLDLNCAERRTETAQFPRSQILGEGLLRFDRRAGRRDDPRLYQESRIGRQAAGPDATEARILIKSDPLSQHPS